jgi:hypothetical protein
MRDAFSGDEDEEYTRLVLARVRARSSASRRLGLGIPIAISAFMAGIISAFSLTYGTAISPERPHHPVQAPEQHHAVMLGDLQPSDTANCV